MKKTRMLLVVILSTNLLGACAASVGSDVALAKRVMNKQCEPATVTVASLDRELKSAGVVAKAADVRLTAACFQRCVGAPRAIFELWMWAVWMSKKQKHSVISLCRNFQP